MTIRHAAAIAALLSLTAGGASAATATGRITYISSDGHQLMLDSNDLYAAGTNLDLSSVAVGNLVRLTWENRAGERLATAVSKAPSGSH